MNKEQKKQRKQERRKQVENGNNCKPLVNVGGKVVPPPRRWKVKETKLVTCSEVGNPVIYLMPIVRSKIELLMEEYKSLEWFGFLVGTVDDKGDFDIDNLVIPPHASVSAGAAIAEPFNEPEGCVGAIHSHHSMGAFHSGTDATHVDLNYPCSITVGKKTGTGLEYEAVSYQTTPCNKKTLLKCKVEYVMPEPLFDYKSFLDEAKENVEKGKTQVTSILPGVVRRQVGGSYFTGFGLDAGNEEPVIIPGTVDIEDLTEDELDKIVKDIHKDTPIEGLEGD